MSALYLDRQGSHLGVRAGRFVVQSGEQVLADLPLEQIDRVLVYGHIALTPAALGLLLERGIPTALLSSHGRLRGLLGPLPGGQVQRRAAQYRLMVDEAAALPTAQILIAAKLRNQHRLLYTALGEQRDAAADPRLDPDAVTHTASLAELRGIEGSAAHAYFGLFPALLASTPFTFMGRNRHPPRDPINAMLSLAYTLLLAEVETGVAVHGLDPYAGVLHAADGHQPACGLDIMEPLRCLADRLVLRLAHHALTPADFTCGDAGCYLADGRRGVFYGAWEALLAERVLWHGVHQEYRRIIHAQVSAYAAHLDDPATPLQPLLLHDIGRV